MQPLLEQFVTRSRPSFFVPNMHFNFFERMGMAYSLKYGKVTVENGDSLNDSDEPVYIIRSQDKSAVDAVLRSRGAAEEIEASEEHILGIEESAGAISDWQEAHPDQVKVPD